MRRAPQPLLLDLVFAALSDATRRGLLSRLIEGEATVGTAPRLHGAAGWQFNAAGAKVIEELRHFVETGESHPRKRRRVALPHSGSAVHPSAP